MADRIPPVTHAAFFGALAAVRVHAGIASRSELGHTWLGCSGIQCVLVPTELHEGYRQVWRAESGLCNSAVMALRCVRAALSRHVLPILTPVELHGLQATATVAVTLKWA